MFSARLARSVVPRAAGVRNYAAAAQSVKPPVMLFGVDGNYASALYTAAAKSSSLEATDKNLKSLKATLDKDPKLARILASPMLNATDKSSVVNEVVKTVGQDKTIKNLLDAMAEHNRLGLLPGVIDKFEVLMGAYKGEMEVLITSSTPLDPKTSSRLENAIAKSQYVGQGKKLKVVNKVNPEILGGLVVEVGDRTIDLSISAKMTKLNKLLTDTL